MMRIAELPAELSTIVNRIASELDRRGHELYLVGGVVRDLLLGARHPQDVDLATDAWPPDTRAALGAAGATVYEVGERFGTIGGVFGDMRVEVTTYRSETYAPGSRKPGVAYGVKLEEDLARRDFTINSIALDPRDGRLVDPFGGCRDLEQGVIRAVGDATERLREDPLRLLRAVRFSSRLWFEIEAPTALAMRTDAAALGTISRERVRDEMDKLLLSPAPAAGVLGLCRLGLAPYVLPELLPLRGMRQEAGRYKDVFAHTLQVLDRTPPRLVLRWGALLHDIAKPRTLTVQDDGAVHFFGHDTLGGKMARGILTDLRHSGGMVDAVSRLVSLHLRANAYATDWTDGAVRRFVREAGEDTLSDLLALSRADVTSGRPEKRVTIARSVAELEGRIGDLKAREDVARLKSPLDGADLMQLMDRGPGPWIKPIKDRLLEMVIDGALATDDRATAERVARTLYAETSATASPTPRA